MATGFRCRMRAIYQSLSLFLGLTYRASPLLWDKYYIIARWLTAYSRCCIDVHSHVRAHDRLVDCGNSYTLRSFMLMKCHCLLVTSNSTSNRPLIFNVFSYNGVYASPFGVRSTVSLSLRLVVPRVLQLLVSLVPTGAIFEISNTRPIFIFIYTSLELGLFVYDLVLWFGKTLYLFIIIFSLPLCTFEHFWPLDSAYMYN